MLSMTVAIPLLYGIPPEYDYLRCTGDHDCIDERCRITAVLWARNVTGP